MGAVVMFIDTPEARAIRSEPEQSPSAVQKCDPDRFEIRLLPNHRWDVIDNMGIYSLWRGTAAGANYQKQALIAYERGDLEEAMRNANLATSTEKNWGKW